MKRYNTPRKNAPIASVIKNFANPQSGKVSESRKEIKRRFDYLDWRHQKRIIMVCLFSCKSDREWIYTKMLNCWDDNFMPRVEQLWRFYREPRCAWVIIRHFPKEYIESHIDELSTGRNYYFICLRLAHNPNFKIDRQQLSAVDYLSVLSLCNRPISTQEGCDILYEITREMCSENELINIPNSTQYVERGEVLRPTHFHEISRALYILQVKGADEAVEKYYEWCEEITNRIELSGEFIKLHSDKISDIEYNRKRKAITTLYMAASLNIETRREAAEESVDNQEERLEEMLNNPQPQAITTPYMAATLNIETRGEAVEESANNQVGRLEEMLNNSQLKLLIKELELTL